MLLFRGVGARGTDLESHLVEFWTLKWVFLYNLGSIASSNKDGMHLNDGRLVAFGRCNELLF